MRVNTSVQTASDGDGGGRRRGGGEVKWRGAKRLRTLARSVSRRYRLSYTTVDLLWLRWKTNLTVK